MDISIFPLKIELQETSTKHIKRSNLGLFTYSELESTKVQQDSYKKIILEEVFNNAADGIITVDEEGTIRLVNNAVGRIFGYEIEELNGKSLNIIIPDKYKNFHNDLLKKYANEGKTRVIGTEREVKGLKKDGTTIYLEVGISKVRSDDKIIMMGVIRDVTDRKRMEKELIHLAHYDQLTGLINRKYFQEYLEKTISRAKRYNQKFAILFMDIDGFKPVNDNFGHDIGDILLQEIAKRMNNILRQGDILARIGGDEFVAILEQTNEENSKKVVKKITAELQKPFTIGECIIEIGISIGAAIFPDHGENEDLLLKFADEAMYKVKNSNKTLKKHK